MTTTTSTCTIDKSTTEDGTRSSRASQGLLVRSGLRAGSRTKTSDREQAAITAYLKS